jgi:MFS family permease
MTTTTMGVGTASKQGVSAGVLAATVAGNALEFYDFLVFSFFAVYISQAFFPPGDPTSNLLKTLAVFWSGFLLRPIGGVVIGAFADKAGRRPAMLLTIGLVTIGTLGLAAIPAYKTIGVAAPVLLVVARCIQGFGLGGDVGPASVYLMEAAPPKARGYYVSWQIASQGLAVMAAGVAGVAMAAILGQEDLAAWGWRVPFVICLTLIPVAFYLRRAMPETLGSEAKSSKAHGSADVSVSDQARYIALNTLIIIGGTVSTYVGNYMSTYAIHTLKLSPVLGLSATAIGGASTFVFALIGGWLGDRYGRKALVLWPRIALMIAIVPVFMWLSSAPSLTTLWLATVVTAGLTAMSAGIGLVILPELLPKRARALGFSVSYAVGVAIFGGSTQFVVTWLIETTKNPAAPAWYVIATSIITLVALLALPETRGRAIE